MNDQMLRALEEDQYSAAGSIVETDSECDDDDISYWYGNKSGGAVPVRLDRAALQQAIKRAMSKTSPFGGRCAIAATASGASDDPDEEEDEDDINNKKKAKKSSRKKQGSKKEDALSDPATGAATGTSSPAGNNNSDKVQQQASSKSKLDDALLSDDSDEDLDRGGSIFGATTGGSNAIWVQCDKCKKWRRLRGVVDEKKLPPKWYCRYVRVYTCVVCVRACV